MWKKTLTVILLTATLLMLLPYAASAAICKIHEPKCIPYTCEICGFYMPHTDPDEHDYKVLSRQNCVLRAICKRCGQIKTSPDHTFETQYTACTTATVCTVCGEQLHIQEHHPFAIQRSDCYTTEVCQVCGKQLRQNTHHAFQPWSTVPCDTSPTCTRCGIASPDTVPHLYMTSFFGGFTYCLRCHEYTFSLADVNWFTVFIVAAGLAFLIALVVLAIKNRGSGMRADRAAKSFGMVEKFPDSPAPRARKTGAETGNPALALHLLKEEDERPQD